MEHPTDGYEPEAPAADPVTGDGDTVAPWRSPTAGLDYSIAPDPQPVQPVVWERPSPIPIAIVAFLAAMAGSLATVGLLAFGGFFGSAEPEALAPPPTTTVTTTVTPSTVIVPELESQVTEAVWRKVSPSIVTVEVGTQSGESITINGSGSGVALGNGYIATNHHVVEGVDFVQIVLQDGRTYDATVVGSDALTDLAVLSTAATDLVAVELGSTADLSIGELTIAVGNPLGQSGGASLTVGVLSALSRRVDFADNSTLFGMLQTDAPITNGSSGGALVDEGGRLIGITSAIGLSEAGAEGIGYAIPVELVRRITDEIIEVGAAHHPFLGIEGQDAIEVADDGARIPAGAEVNKVDPVDGAAGRAGIEAADVIVGMDGVEISTMSELVVQLRLFRVGDTIEIDIDRDGEQLRLTVVLDERPEGL